MRRSCTVVDAPLRSVGQTRAASRRGSGAVSLAAHRTFTVQRRADMRSVSIVVALLAGLASLFVSVCGGGFFVTFSYTAIRSMLYPTAMLQQTAAQVALNFLPHVDFCGCLRGVWWPCVFAIHRSIRREWLRRD